MNLGCRKDRCHHEGSSFLGMGLTQRKAEQEMEGPESTSFEPLDSDKLKAYCASRSGAVFPFFLPWPVWVVFPHLQ